MIGHSQRTHIVAVIAFVLMLCSSGCLLVRTTEHIITLREDGGGEGVIHLIDIRSDAPSDSLVRLDFDELMKAYGARKVEEFEKYGRRITAKRLRVRGDTLMAEITYVFSSYDAVEGLRVSPNEMAIEFSPEREVIKTNGKMSRMENQGTRITWKRATDRLVYEVREKELPPSVSLVFLYKKYGR